MLKGKKFDAAEKHFEKERIKLNGMIESGILMGTFNPYSRKEN